MSRRAYGGTRVNHVNVSRLVHGRAGRAAVVGVDVGKHKLLAVCRWSDARFERPWSVNNPSELGSFVGLLQQVGQDRLLTVALELSGTYGDALRQALADAGIAVVRVSRVSTKASHDYAEIFDGVPSQHDGKDAAVVAELAALGKCVAWPYQPASVWEQELAYQVDRMVSQRQVVTMWQGRLEGLLARHWPEATRVLRLSSKTLLLALRQYGSAQTLAADPEAAERLQRWGRGFLAAAKIERFLAEAHTSVGVRPGVWEQRRVQEYARQALEAHRQAQQAARRLAVLARGHAVLSAQGKVVGVPTACVLWVHTGDPRKYDSGGAYRKAFGLNLMERSSGDYQGPLHISKRGSARSRQWLYFAALRLVQKAGVRSWYEAKKGRERNGATRVVVALMRKLALALYQVGAQEQEFEVQRLFARLVGSDKIASQASAAGASGVEGSE